MADHLDHLPADVARHRVLTSAQAASFWGVSLPHWRRLYRKRQVPSPVMLGARKLGWRAGDLVDGLAARIKHTPSDTSPGGLAGRTPMVCRDEAAVKRRRDAPKHR